MKSRRHYLRIRDEEVDLNAALKWLNAAVMNTVGHSLREPELVILKGTWRGLTYEQMAEGSDYSTNYLMRDVAPKLWRQLSSVFGRSVGKTNFRVALEAYAATNPAGIEPLTTNAEALSSASASGFTDAAYRTANSKPRSSSEPPLYWHPAVLSEQGPKALATPQPAKPAVSSTLMYGYQAELAQINRWMDETASGQGQIIGVWGLKAVGKTLLVEKAIARSRNRFEAVVWRSLQSQPSLDQLSASILASLGISAAVQASAQLLSLMNQRSLLIVIESVEAILQPQALAGGYASTYEGYGEFFQSAIASRSCIVLTGIEGPTELVRQSGAQTGIRAITLNRLSKDAATQLLRAELTQPNNAPTSSLQNSETQNVETLFESPENPTESFSIVAGALIQEPTQEPAPEPTQEPIESSQNAASISTNPPAQAQWQTLIERYQAHPFALKSACRVIREIFNGQIDEFLTQTSVLFTDILRILAPSFDRITAAEKNALYWLASQDAPLTLQDLRKTPSLSTGSVGLISVLDSLKQRSLLEIDRTGPSPKFYLSALIKAYAVHQFVDGLADSQTAQSRAYASTGVNLDQVIDLSTSPAVPIQLSQWLSSRFSPDWQSLDQLFKASARPAMRLRSAYYIQDESFVKRCKPIDMKPSNSAHQSHSVPAMTPFSAIESETTSTDSKYRAALVIAIHQDTETLYKLCVQAQPTKEDSILPNGLMLRLLDAQQKVLAEVDAREQDTFIQLPYFRGVQSESFTIELALGDRTYQEDFLI